MKKKKKNRMHNCLSAGIRLHKALIHQKTALDVSHTGVIRSEEGVENKKGNKPVVCQSNQNAHRENVGMLLFYQLCLLSQHANICVFSSDWWGGCWFLQLMTENAGHVKNKVSGGARSERRWSPKLSQLNWRSEARLTAIHLTVEQDDKWGTHWIHPPDTSDTCTNKHNDR